MQRSISLVLDGFSEWTIEETITSPKGGLLYLIVLGKISGGDTPREFIVFADGDVVEL